MGGITLPPGSSPQDGCDSCLMPSPGQAVPLAITRPSPFGRAQRVPSPGPSAPVCICSYWGLGKGRTVCPCSATPVSPQISYSVLRRLATRPKTQFTPLPSASRVQQVREGRGGHRPRPGLGEEEGDGWVQGESWHLTSDPGPRVEWPLPSTLP